MRGRLPSFHWFGAKEQNAFRKYWELRESFVSALSVLTWWWWLMALVDKLGISCGETWGKGIFILRGGGALSHSPLTHSVETCGTLVLPSLELVFLFGEHHHTLMLDSRLRPLTLAPLLKLNYPLWYMPIFTQLINHLGDDSGLLYFGCIYLLL